jgi:hypothetical protein
VWFLGWNGILYDQEINKKNDTVTITDIPKLYMESANQPDSIFHRIAHGFVYGICVIYLGITPPPPEKELRFMSVVAVVIVLLAMMGVLFGWFLIQMVFKR